MDQLRHRVGFLADHRLDVLVQQEVVDFRDRLDPLDQLDRVGTGEDEVGFVAGQRFHADRDISLGQPRQRPGKHFGGIAHRLLARDSLEQVSLGRRPKDHQFPAQVGTCIAKCDHVVACRVADGGIGRGQVEAFSLSQQPVQADDLQVSRLGLLP